MSTDPNQDPGVCPFCGATSEDFIDYGDEEYQCPGCEEMVAEDEILTIAEYRIYKL